MLLDIFGNGLANNRGNILLVAVASMEALKQGSEIDDDDESFTPELSVVGSSSSSGFIQHSYCWGEDSDSATHNLKSYEMYARFKLKNVEQVSR